MIVINLKVATVTFRIGLVIDLTNTRNYYQMGEICVLKCDYYKLQIKGQLMPHECFVQQFIKVRVGTVSKVKKS